MPLLCLAAFVLMACGSSTIAAGPFDEGAGPADTGPADTGDDFVPTGPDWSQGDTEPEGDGLAKCAWTGFQVAREEFAGDAQLLTLMGNSDLSGNVDLCSAIFVSRSRAGMVATVYTTGGSSSFSEEPVPDLPLCTNGSLRYADVVDTPLSGWHADSDVLAAVFADVPSNSGVWVGVVPAEMVPDVNLCSGGNYHLDVGGSSRPVLAAAARDCGESGSYCAVALDAASGEVLDRQ